MSIIRFLSAAILVLGCSATAEAATLTLKIDGADARGGILRVGVYNRALYPDNNATPIAFADVPCHGGENTIVLEHVPPGDYAVETYQDINGNDKMDTDWFGLPTEPFGFSRNASPYFSKPDFDDVKIAVEEGNNVQSIHLRYYFS